MTDNSKRLAVFELGKLPEEIAHRHPDYPAMISRWLSPSLPEMSFTGMSPVGGEALPAPDAFDGYVYSGSRHGIYDALDWIEPLKSFIRAVAEAGKPQFGICFGHQIMAEALGGKAVKSERGWGCGVDIYDIQLSKYNDLVTQVPVMIWHQDQVIALPDSAEVLGGNEFCPIGVVRYQVPALSVQFHPEFSKQYMTDLLDLRGGTVISAELTAAARKSLQHAPDAKLVSEWTGDFFREQLQ